MARIKAGDRIGYPMVGCRFEVARGDKETIGTTGMVTAFYDRIDPRTLRTTGHYVVTDKGTFLISDCDWYMTDEAMEWNKLAEEDLDDGE